MNKYLYTVRAYPIVCEDDTISWGAEFVEIKGCVGGGETIQEAIEDAYKNLEDYLEFLKKNKQFIPIPNVQKQSNVAFV